MRNGIEAMITDITATTAEAEDYTGEDGLLYCGKCHTPKEAYFSKRNRPMVRGMTDTRQSATASGQPVKNGKPLKADRSTLKQWRT